MKQTPKKAELIKLIKKIKPRSETHDLYIY